jgi:molybdenum-dependent DNA-binding transcriptional regulator ModE
MAASSNAQVRVRIDLGSGASVGPGKIALPGRIGTRGSLLQALRETASP